MGRESGGRVGDKISFDAAAEHHTPRRWQHALPEQHDVNEPTPDDNEMTTR